mgnify:CR=1 FL=1
MFSLNITMDTFGGERVMMEKLAELGLISKNVQSTILSVRGALKKTGCFHEFTVQSVTRSIIPQFPHLSQAIPLVTFPYFCLLLSTFH